MINFEEVFKILDEAQISHQSWLDAPDSWYDESNNTNGDIGGDRNHHRLWLGNYKKIREVLEACQQYIWEHK